MLKLLPILLIAGCSTKSKKPVYGDNFPEKLAQANAKFQANVKPWLNCDFPAKTNCEDDGDSLLWIGLHCLSSAQYCYQVSKSMSEDGQIWRSPRRVNVDQKNSFSRDMSLGALSYFLSTRDNVNFDRWVRFIKAHDNKVCLNAEDNRCNLTANIKTMINLVGSYIAATEKIDGDLSLAAYKISLQIAAATSEPGYPLHLVAIQLYLLQLMGHEASTSEIAKRQPNAFTHFVNKDYHKTVDEVLNKMPEVKPANDYQWSFERATSSEAWKESMGYEFEFIINALNRK